MKRESLAIFVVVTDDGILDDYVFYFASKIKELVKTLVVTVQGVLNEYCQNYLKRYCDKIFLRENKGYDCAAFKETLERFIGWEKVCRYKELILVNDSCYGPIYPLPEMFSKMDKSKCDFWGVTEQTPIKRLYYKNALYPYHIQTYFVVVKDIMLHSEAFREFWNSVQIPNNYSEAVENFELKFTSFFNSLGFRSGAYIDCAAFCKSTEETQAYVFMDSYRLISEYKCPFVKKKVFTFAHETVLSSNLGETASKTLAYIKENTDYDSELIWKCLIRKCNVNDIRISMHLDFCLSTKNRTEVRQFKKVLLIAMFLESDLEDKYFSYIAKLPRYIDVIFCVSRKVDFGTLKEVTDDYGIEVKKILDLSGENVIEHHILDGYEYLCVLNNSKRCESDIEILWENMVANEIYVENVIGIFEKEKRLGFLSPPTNCNVSYGETYSSDQLCGFLIKHFMKKMELSCQVDEQHLPFSYGNAFWCRTVAMRPLLENEKWKHCLREMAPGNIDLMMKILEKVYPYVAQSQGYYSGVVMTEECASRLIGNYYDKLCGQIHNLCIDIGINEFKNIGSVNTELLDFCKRFKGVYVFGAGEKAYACLLYLHAKCINVKGVIVSYKKIDDYFAGKKVSTLAETEIEPGTGIVIALSQAHIKEVEGLLKEKGKIDYILYER